MTFNLKQNHSTIYNGPILFQFPNMGFFSNNWHLDILVMFDPSLLDIRLELYENEQY